ncbi:synaptobrevin homolog YKT6-like [Branchiostoma floridae]|uniref:Synaptobrevin homolog YKT6-like n=1 Tax=Branchiostoma floridae TaxID=7739 RepID=C3Y4B1_BRAFL|nr:synaptobrevin homolog YKT6-like [Branchiostoma floridae]|eukprot:XP_002609127.1 hypothetical protein BRAFLDRAFT_126152 [Branchiostoma floridae]
MKLYSLSVLYKRDSKVHLLMGGYDLQSFGYFQRGSVKEFMVFTSQIIVERCREGSRSTVKEQEYMCHCYIRTDGLGGVLIADHEYPQRVAFTLLNKVLDDFTQKVPAHLWPDGNQNTIHYTELDGYLAKYQNPREADSMMKIQSELDETKIILHKSIEAVLERGEKLDDLVAKSEDLSVQSKTFYKTAKKQNQCCVIL